MGDLLRITDVSEILQVSGSTVRRLIENGELPAMRVGESIRLQRAEVESYIARLEKIGKK